MAEGQARALMKRMEKDNEMMTSYEAEFRKLKELRFISKADTNFKGIYTILPHHPVVRKDKITSKVRPVFNGSAKPKTGFSANDCLEEGPNLNPDILDVILTFRLNPIAWTADIRQAFLMPGSAQDRPKETPRVIQRRTSSKQSPNVTASICRRLLVKCAYIRSSKDRNRYGTQTFSDAKMELRKWVTNDPQLREYLQQSNLTDDSSDSYSCLNLDPQKVLGVRWNTSTDCFYFKSDVIVDAAAKFKLLFQELWQEKIGWDDNVNSQTESRFRAIVEDLKGIDRIQIPRMISTAPTDGSTTPENEVSLPRLELLSAELGSVLAERIVNAIDKVKWEVTLWTDSMAALGWIKGDPRRWKLFVRNRVETIQKRFKPEHWKHCPGKDNPADFASRSCSVKKLTEAFSWWEGPSWLKQESSEWPQQDNPTSDDLQLMEVETKSKQRIQILAVFNMPDWLDSLVLRVSSYLRLLRTIAWMYRLMKKLPPGKAIETVGVAEIHCLSVCEISTAENFILRTIQQKAFPEIYGSLKEGKSNKKLLRDLDTLRPIWDEKQQLIRVTGRVGPALRDLLIEPPILLPANERIVDLLIHHHHVKRKHTGVQSTLTYLRNRFWIIRVRQRIKSVIKHCGKCQRAQSRPFDEEAASMPLDRTKKAQPFEIIGIDYFGPMYVLEEVLLIEKDKEGNDVEKTRVGEKKVHACLFTCAVTRAVHLELVTILTTKTFMLALRRMMSRREDCKTIYSDNASTFTCAAKLVTEDPTLANWLSSKGIEWKFSPSLAPWWGGFWERMVRSVKEPLRKVLGKMKVSYDQLHTILVEIEAIVNSRPLTYVSGDAQAYEVLSPQRLLTGRQPGATPEASELTTMSHNELIDLDKQRSEHALTWWRLWQESYLSDLKRFHCRKGKGAKYQACFVAYGHYNEIDSRL
ncbi:uncharacterized protein LOC123474486 [Daphnia magna]|uniref:uncharacterized protein LOC123474486 n=1 Tax=Daphnia magna TaxID=35525 RepID=UPI001E1BD5AE|nr:uncharacterized protein LOC123474486 [Daphnia magna]